MTIGAGLVEADEPLALGLQPVDSLRRQLLERLDE
jgi:hypothetical protein